MTRDMTAKQFKAALERNGFKHDFLFWFRDTTGQTSTGYSGLFWPNGKVARRDTLAHLITSRANDLKRAKP